MRFGDKFLSLNTPQVMGVLNVTPDSFSDGGRYNSLDAAMVKAEAMLKAGASIIDVGGESTRPGAKPVGLQEELDRVCPVVERLVCDFDALVSVDTSSPELMREAISLGCSMLNDVRAFSRSGAIEVISDAQVAICLMHMQGEPSTMQHKPSYQQVVADVAAYLNERCEHLLAAGISSERLIVDPGFGFGKTLDHNLSILKHLDLLTEGAWPVLVGMSRKSMIGAITGKEVAERVSGSVAAALLAAQKGAAILRVHDVSETVDALKILSALELAQ